MSKFILFGTMIEEPKYERTTNGIDYCSIIVEEKSVRELSKKEFINRYQIEFFGNYKNAIPSNVRLVGATVVITGSISGAEFKGKYYSHLRGDGFTLVSLNGNNSVAKFTQASASEDTTPKHAREDKKYSSLEENEDLPF